MRNDVPMKISLNVSASSLVVKYLISIQMPRVRFPAGAPFSEPKLELHRTGILRGHGLIRAHSYSDDWAISAIRANCETPVERIEFNARFLEALRKKKHRACLSTYKCKVPPDKINDR